MRDRSAELKTVRLRVLDLDQASRYFDKMENEEEPHYNYRVRSPELPRAEFLEGEEKLWSQCGRMDWRTRGTK